MLLCGLILIIIASIVGGWVFMCDALTIPPMLAQSPTLVLLAVVIALAGTVLLFLVKWYIGLIAIVGSIVGFNLFAAVWSVVYRIFRL